MNPDGSFGSPMFKIKCPECGELADKAVFVIVDNVIKAKCMKCRYPARFGT